MTPRLPETAKLKPRLLLKKSLKRLKRSSARSPHSLQAPVPMVFYPPRQGSGCAVPKSLKVVGSLRDQSQWMPPPAHPTDASQPSSSRSSIVKSRSIQGFVLLVTVVVLTGTLGIASQWQDTMLLRAELAQVRVDFGEWE